MAEAAHAYEIHPECADEDTNLFWWRRGLIQSPRAVVRWDHTDENRTSRGLAEKGRRVSWSELFLDLVLVTNVALLGDAYNSGDLTVVEASVLYRAIYNCWWATTLYAGRFHVDDLLHKTMTGLLMFLLLCAGLRIGGYGFVPTAKQLAVSVGLYHFTIVLIYIRVMLALPHTRAFLVQHSIAPALIQGIGHCAVLALSGKALARPSLMLLLISLASADILWHTIFYNCFRLSKRLMVPVHIDHMVERRGCLRLIVFGEVVVGCTVSPSHFGFGTVSTIGLAFLIILCMKLLCFDVDVVPASRHSFRVGSYIRPIIWLEASFFFDLSMIFLGASTRVVLTILLNQNSEEADWRHTDDAHVILCLCVATGFATLTIERLMHDQSHILGADHWLNKWGTVYRRQQPYARLLGDERVAAKNGYQSITKVDLESPEDNDDTRRSTSAATGRLIFWFQIATHVTIVAAAASLAFYCTRIPINSKCKLVLVGIAIMTSAAVVINLLDEVATMADVGAGSRQARHRRLDPLAE